MSEIVPTYEVIREYARGGMGITYLVRRVSDGTVCILKQLRFDRVKDWKVVELFEREAAVLRSLDHPRIPTYVDSIQQDDHLCLVQSFIEGKTLQQLIDEKASLDPEGFREYLAQCLEILTYLHSRIPPVIHRDITPKNIIIRDGQAYLVDFGAVKHPGTGNSSGFSTTIGTFGFMAPEQMMGKAGPGADMYSLGMTFLSLATHADPTTLPLDEHTGQFDIRTLLEMPDAVEAVLEGMTRINLAERVQDAEAALRILRAAPGTITTKTALTSAYVEVSYQSLAEVRPIKVGKVVIKNELNLIRFIEQGDEWFDLLIKDRHGLEALLGWVAQVQDLENKKRFEDMIDYYLGDERAPPTSRKRKPPNPNVKQDAVRVSHLREAILRYWVPERPIRIGDRSYHFFLATDRGQEYKGVISAISNTWKSSDPASWQQWIVETELSLRQLWRWVDEGEKKRIEELLQAFLSCFVRVTDDEVKQSLIDRDMRARTFLQIDADSVLCLIQSQEGARPFEGIRGERLNSVEEVALYFAAGEDRIDSTTMRAELKAFLAGRNLMKMYTETWSNLLFNMLGAHTHTAVVIRRIGREQRVLTIRCFVRQSLTDYLKRNGLVNILEMDSDIGEFCVRMRKNEPDLFADFISQVRKHYHLSNATADALSVASHDEFKRHLDVIGIRVASPGSLVQQTLRAGLILFPLLIFTVLVETFVDRNLKFLFFLNGVLPFRVDAVHPFDENYGYNHEAFFVSLLLLVLSTGASTKEYFRTKWRAIKRDGLWEGIGESVFLLVLGGNVTVAATAFALAIPTGMIIVGSAIVPVAGISFVLLRGHVRWLPALYSFTLLILLTLVLFAWANQTTISMAPGTIAVGYGLPEVSEEKPDVSIFHRPGAFVIARASGIDPIQVFGSVDEYYHVQQGSISGFVKRNDLHRCAIRLGNIRLDSVVVSGEPSGSVLTLLKFQDPVEVLEISGAQYLVRHGSPDSETTGWVDTNSVTLSDKSTATLRMILTANCGILTSGVRVWVDDREIGRLSFGDTLFAEVFVGRHQLKGISKEMIVGPEPYFVALDGMDWKIDCSELYRKEKK